MKDILFSQLEKDDSVWVVYNKNYDNKKYTELILVEGKIIENNLEDRKIDISDRWEEPYYKISKEYWMVISVSGLENTYRRYYSNTYNEMGYMLMTPEFIDHAPDIEVFVTKEKAKEYIISCCERSIQRLEKIIERSMEEINLNKKCINITKDM